MKIRDSNLGSYLEKQLSLSLGVSKRTTLGTGKILFKKYFVVHSNTQSSTRIKVQQFYIIKHGLDNCNLEKYSSR